uniref:Uncharacterized protein n=1 Tax=Romanomermis culicivorax TaxID=13658 RepID=A0A915HYJ9_ROMCU
MPLLEWDIQKLKYKLTAKLLRLIKSFDSSSAWSTAPISAKDFVRSFKLLWLDITDVEALDMTASVILKCSVLLRCMACIAFWHINSPLALSTSCIPISLALKSTPSSFKFKGLLSRPETFRILLRTELVTLDPKKTRLTPQTSRLPYMYELGSLGIYVQIAAKFIEIDNDKTEIIFNVQVKHARSQSCQTLNDKFMRTEHLFELGDRKKLARHHHWSVL